MRRRRLHPTQPPVSSEGTIGRDNGKYTLQRNVEEVVLNATVLDDKQHMAHPAKENFQVTEDGVPQTIAPFQHQDIPISLGILVDNSGSMRTKRQAVNASALDLVSASNPDDETFIVNFADEAYMDQDLTSNVPKLREGLAHIDSKGGTALYDAIIASADYLTKNAKRPKQVLLVITDGEDNASSTTLEETVRRIQDLQGPVVYSIGLLFDDSGGGSEARRARRALEMLANETGGVAYFPKNLKQVDTIADEVARIFATSTPSATTRPSRPAREASHRSTLMPKLRAKANSQSAPAPATIPTSKKRRLPRAQTRPPIESRKSTK